MDCCDNAGGRIILTLGNKRYATRGGVTIRPTNKERAVGANDDGSIYITTKAVPAEAEFTISDKCGLVLDDLDQCFIDATFDLIDMRKKFFFTRSSVIGRPEINSETGEIKGLKIVTSDARQQNY